MTAHLLLVSGCRIDLNLEYSTVLNHVLIFAALSGVWLRVLTSRLAPGLPRLLAVLPILVGNLLSPKLFCRRVDAVTIVLVAFNTMWLSSFKALAWALDRGPLADPLLTAPQFLAVYLAPLTPRHEATGKAKKGRLGEQGGGAGEMLGAWLAKQGVIGVVVALLVGWPSMPGVLVSLLNTLGLYGLLSSIMDGPAVLLTGLLGMQLSPHFDRPWLANSVASFWNKRWDLAAGNTLRTLVFDPVIEGRLVHDPKAPTHRLRSHPWRQLAGTTASFLVSGLIHELIYWYMQGTHTRGRWLAYFVAQAPLVVAERLVLAALKSRHVLLPNPLRILLTLTTQTLLAHWLFWGPMVGPPADQVVHNVREAMEGLQQAFHAVLH